MAAARAKARGSEAGARCHRAPGPPPRPKARRTARRRRAETLTARRSRPSAGERRAGSQRAWSGAPRAAVFGDECARGALFKGCGILSCKMERMARFYKHLGALEKPQVSTAPAAVL
uniref:Suppressor of variegation 3-9 2 n=1 Tax=Mus musculus TaxID=10090 RepID=E0CZC9_MOUSE